MIALRFQPGGEIRHPQPIYINEGGGGGGGTTHKPSSTLCEQLVRS